MSDTDSAPERARWALLRFSIIGPLLSAPPDSGELKTAIAALAARSWKHPAIGEMIRFAPSTIERWYYDARNAPNPVDALARKVPSHTGTFPSMPPPLLGALIKQHQQHPSWSYQLHCDNLAALVKEDTKLGPMPSYGTIVRVMKARGLLRWKRRRPRDGDAPSNESFEPRERRSFEVAHVNGLWHSDFHDGSRKVLLPDGTRADAFALSFLDDCSRLACHLQWYLEANAESFIHGLSQAIQKRGLPRALLTDRGGPMRAAETTQGLERLSITPHLTLPYSPEQNGKQEVLWAQVEGRLMAMLEGEPELTLSVLNTATQAWVELEYNRAHHSELGESPLDRFLRDKSVARPSPSSDALRRAFRVEERRTQRRSDGTITVEGVRFELPARYCTLLRPMVRFARWDLSSVDLVDPRTGAHLAVLLPLDKQANADGRRRRVEAPTIPATPPEPAGIAPRLRLLMADYAATGLPPAYVPLEPEEGSEE